MLDLNDLRVFERVAAFSGFSAAARALGIPKSSVSRSVQRLELELSTRLVQRTTREVVLTETGVVLHGKCAELLEGVQDTLDLIGSLGDRPRGCLRISTGIAFGINVLGELLPRFADQYPDVDISLDLTSVPVDLVRERIDVAIRMGPMQDSQIVARKLGAIHRYVCASPAYLAKHGIPETFEDLRRHDILELPAADGRASWRFSKVGQVVHHQQAPRICVNDMLTLHRLLLNGAGIGLDSGYLCVPDLQSGRLTRLFGDWTVPSLEVHAVFPSRRELAPVVRAFVDFMCKNSREGHHWQKDPLAAELLIAA